MKKEVKAWPYSFAASDDFPKSDQRGKVKGKLLVYDRYLIFSPNVFACYCSILIPSYLNLIVYIAHFTDLYSMNQALLNPF